MRSGFTDHQRESFYPVIFSGAFFKGGRNNLAGSGNPIMRDVSEEGKYSRNFSRGQFVKAIGSLSDPVLPVLAARYWNADWKIVFPIYSVIVLITLIWASALKVEEKNMTVRNRQPLNLVWRF